MVLLGGVLELTLLQRCEVYGNPARVEIECIADAVCDENTYYNNKDAVKYICWFYYWKRNIPWTTQVQEWCWEIKADKNGKVITHGEYIEQQSKVKSDRTPFQVRGGKLPGVE